MKKKSFSSTETSALGPIRMAHDSIEQTQSDKPLIELLASSAQFFIFSYSPLLRSLITWSENAKVILGVDDARIARDGNLFLRYVHVDDRFQLLNDLESALEGETDFRATYRWIRPDRKEMRWLHCRASLNTCDKHNSIFEGIILDISDELAGPLKYFSGSESLHGVISALPAIVVILDTELRITRLNYPTEAKDFSFGDFAFKSNLFGVGHRITDCISDFQISTRIKGIAASIFSASIKKESFRISERGKNYKVDIFPQLCAKATDKTEKSIITGLICVISDISDFVQLESKLADLQRTESLRLLSAGVGHHFNNTLQGIIGQASIINNHPENLELVKSASDSIIASSLKAADLTRQLFSSIEKSSPQLCPIDANLALTEAINKVPDLFHSGFEVSFVLGQLPLVLGKQESICQSFEAVLANARDALNKKLGHLHQLSIKTYTVDLAQDEVAPLTEGTYAKIVIIDSGVGMDYQTRTHCLDPFFTTKETDLISGINLEGSGLGLSKALATVRSLGGMIKIESDQPLGSCIEIFLPAASSQFTDGQIKASAKESLAGSPRILFIDDDETITFTLQAMLKGLNQECLIANDNLTALKLMRRFKHSIELVLLDAILPATDSSLILKKIKKINPSVAIIGFSGAAPEQTKRLLEAGALEIVNKPIQISKLKELLERYLAGGPQLLVSKG